MADPATLETPAALAAPATHFADDFAARASSADVSAVFAASAAPTSAGALDPGKTTASNGLVPAVPASTDASAASISAGAPDSGKTAASNGPVPAVLPSADAPAASTSAGALDPGKTTASNELVPAVPASTDASAASISADAPAASTSAGAPDSGKTAASNEPVPAVPASAAASATSISAGVPDPGKAAVPNGPVPAVLPSAPAAFTSTGAPDPGKTAASNGLVPAVPASADAPDSAAFADMPDPATFAVPVVPDDDAAHLTAPFVQQLVKQLRAQDAHGAWDGKSDLQLLRPYVLTPEERRAIPIIGDPDPETLWRLEIFYNAIAVAIERETRQMVSPMMKMSHEGFGRMVLLAGRLVVVNKQLRDVHRFGFASLAKLAQTGSQFVAEAVEMIRAWPEVADYGT